VGPYPCYHTNMYTKHTLSPKLVEFAHHLANTSGPLIRRYFRTSLVVEDKNDTSPVTIADKLAETAMRELIMQTYPTHGILGEETGTSNLQADYVWVLDPIDGTKSFITGKPLFGTLIALLYQGTPILGVIDQPILKERWIGGKGVPTTLNGQPARVRQCPDSTQAILYATSPQMFKPGPEEDFFNQVRNQVKLTLYGCDCYAYALLASGFVDLVIEASLAPYDYCALVPVIENAGGIITDWQGQPLGLHSSGQVIAAGDQRIHKEDLTTFEKLSNLGFR